MIIGVTCQQVAEQNYRERDPFLSVRFPTRPSTSVYITVHTIKERDKK